ncbi:3-ketoacyl-(acyl-carrier-protein) reductase [Advenella kashmirensis WT001]|uniref:3-ketoacyl-(Acyl-carrier-protein) reductase n=1 Tax=Advenella kashmirensis (strain DSM 17095 / LMG 22695 / WT001) TaxID=1036672 RepID=I3UEX8_ADVKW|nr:SDR family oxidoreductase [Advenella kashmirensis]AFK63566.1 3-ketoacyl-(acyl-carrier-protein) reductase [Advenella kashmirensis WT001]
MAVLDKKIAIVTGAGSGFGEGIATAYINEGAKVIVADINEATARRVADALGNNASAFTVDVSNGEQVRALVAHCVDTFGAPDIVVNNAAITHKNQPMLDVDEAMFDRMFDVNVKSIYHMAQAVVPVMRQRGAGVILNIGSTAGIRPRPGLSWYNASKGAVNVLSKSMAVELGPDNIRVNAICPVMGITGMFELFMGLPDTPENRAKFISSIPLGRFSKPKDVAAAAVFLASDAAAFMTGVELPVDGGRTV